MSSWRSTRRRLSSRVGNLEPFGSIHVNKRIYICIYILIYVYRYVDIYISTCIYNFLLYI